MIRRGINANQYWVSFYLAYSDHFSVLFFRLSKNLISNHLNGRLGEIEQSSPRCIVTELVRMISIVHNQDCS